MEVRAKQNIFCDGSYRVAGQKWPTSLTREQVEESKNLTIVEDGDEDNGFVARKAQAEAESAKNHAAAVATSSDGVIAKAKKGKPAKAKPELPGGQAPTAKVTEAGSK